ncbi:MAG: helix-turn-helix transcriptional regulator [Thermodesulfovibrionia bacterium]|nr:helix-turn-helix transcriptional regulator [Thermodesulfovibrionia bacterium]
MTYREHRKELLKDKRVKEEYEKLIPEYKLAKSIIEQRLKKKMTQEEVAKKAGMPQSTISRIEDSPTDCPNFPLLRRLPMPLTHRLS